MGRIESLTLRYVQLPLVRPFKISVFVYEKTETLLVEIRDSNGDVGYGEVGGVRADYSAETADTAWRFLAEIGRKAIGVDGGAAIKLLEPHREKFPTSCSAVTAAIEMLERDALLQVNEGARIPLLVPVQSMEPGKVTEEANTHLAAGHKTLKCFVGFDVNGDLVRLGELQRAVGDRATIRLDGNQSFSREQGIEFAKRIDPYSPHGWMRAWDGARFERPAR